jgi:hypothetical protein
MSANNTVTCFRSPSSAFLEVRIFSARCFGVYDSGERSFVAVAAWASGAPHSLQYLFVGGLDARQEGHSDSSRAPHSPQNFTPGGFSCWQREHCISKYILTVAVYISKCENLPESTSSASMPWDHPTDHVVRRTAGGNSCDPASQSGGFCVSLFWLIVHIDFPTLRRGHLQGAINSTGLKEAPQRGMNQ